MRPQRAGYRRGSEARELSEQEEGQYVRRRGEGQVLDEQAEGVTGTEPGRGRASFSAGRGASQVVDDSVGDVEAAVAREPGAEAEVAVFAVRDEVLVEEPDLLEERPPVESGGCARPEDVTGLIEPAPVDLAGIVVLGLALLQLVS